jgi:hypothetical protein
MQETLCNICNIIENEGVVRRKKSTEELSSTIIKTLLLACVAVNVSTMYTLDQLNLSRCHACNECFSWALDNYTESDHFVCFFIAEIVQIVRIFELLKKLRIHYQNYQKALREYLTIPTI